MHAEPLNRPLRELSPGTVVYVLRRGRALRYTAGILRDQPNDMWLMQDDASRAIDAQVGDLLAQHIERPGMTGTMRETALIALCHDIWGYAPDCDPDCDLVDFACWWENVDTNAGAAAIGSACRAAARSVMSAAAFRAAYIDVDPGCVGE